MFSKLFWRQNSSYNLSANFAIRSTVLQNTILLRRYSLDLQDIRKEMEQKVMEMTKAKLSLPEYLQVNEHFGVSSSLKYTISYGPPSSPNKYKDQDNFLCKPPKQKNVYPVLSIIAPSGYGKTHFMYHCASNGDFVVPIGLFFEQAISLQNKIATLIKQKKRRYLIEKQVQLYVQIVIETLNFCNQTILRQDFVELLLCDAIRNKLSQYVENKYMNWNNSSITPTVPSTARIRFFIDDAHKFINYFEGNIKRLKAEHPKEKNIVLPNGNAITLLTSVCRKIAPVVLMSHQNTFSDYITTTGITNRKNYTHLCKSLVGLQDSENVSFLEDFITTNIGFYVQFLVQVFLQGKVGYIQTLLDEIIASKESVMTTQQQMDDAIIKRMEKLIYNTMDSQTVNASQILKNCTTIPLYNPNFAVLFQLFTIFAKIYCCDESVANGFESFLTANGISFYRGTHCFYLLDMVLSARLQLHFMQLDKYYTSIIQQWVEVLNQKSVVELVGHSSKALNNIFAASLLCDKAYLFGFERKSFVIKNEFRDYPLRLLILTCLLHPQSTLAKTLVVTRSSDFATILTDIKTKQDYLCVGTHVSTKMRKYDKQYLQMKIIQNFMMCHHFCISTFYHAATENLTTFGEVKCLRLLFLADMTLNELFTLFDVSSLTNLYARFASIEMYNVYHHSNTFIHILMEEIGAELDQFTILVGNHKVCFVTKDHPVFSQTDKQTINLLQTFLQ